VVDREAIEGGLEDYLSISPVIPLAIPDCFRRALPYSDCTFNYDVITGEKYASGVADQFKATGARIEQYLMDESVRASFGYMEESEYARGKIMVGGGYSLSESREPGQSSASFYDYSEEFPAGFGYALNADGAAGPSISAEDVNAALEGAGPTSQIDPAALAELWGGAP
jgi:hypothetical protein